MLQVVTPQRMELLRVKLREEIEGPYKEVQLYTLDLRTTTTVLHS